MATTAIPVVILAAFLTHTRAVQLVNPRTVTYQTGVWSGMTAEKAVDGYKDGTDAGVEYYKSVCAHPDTGDSATPAQWSVDLGGIYRISTITVWNTYDSGGYPRMRNFEVWVNQTGQADVICGSRGNTPVPAGGSDTFTCPGIVTGSGVFLRKLPEAPDPHLITICEVMVDGEGAATTTPALPTAIPPNQNIALNKPTNQSGTHMSDSRWTSDKAVNGFYDVEGANNSPGSSDKLINCARVDSPGDPGQPAEWWVDLGELYTVTTVIVHNAYWDQASVRMKYFTIDVIHPDAGVTLCVRYNSNTSIPQGGTHSAGCNIVGRYVRFKRFDGDEVDRVTICEVEVAGEIYQVSYDYTNQHIATSAMSPTFLILEWDQIPVSSGPSQDYGYLVVYRATHGAAERQENVPYDSSVTRRSLTLSGLSPNTQYVVEIRPYRLQDGVRVYGDNFPRQRITTPCGAPDQTENVQTATKVASGDTNERIEITYELPSVTGCNSIEAVWVEYRPQTEGSWLSTGADTVGDPITVIVDAPGTYALRFYIRNDNNLQRVQDLPAVVVSAVPVTPAPSPPTSSITPAPSDSPTSSPDNSPTPATGVGTPTTQVVVLTSTTSKSNMSESGTEIDDEPVDTAVIGGTVGGALVVIALVVFLVIFLRRRKSKKAIEDPSGVISEQRADETESKKPAQYMNVPLTSKQPRETKPKKAPKPEPSGSAPIPSTSDLTSEPQDDLTGDSEVSLEENPYVNGVVTVRELESYVIGRKANKKSFNAEYKTLPGARVSKCITAQTDDNKIKNRYLNIYPYDVTRVILDEMDGDGDYINANHITGYAGKKNAYIATQGPRKNTLHDLWRMVWKEKADRIVMVANPSENSRSRVDVYWVDTLGDSDQFGDFTVCLESMETCADYTTRTLSVQHAGETRTVRHFHFTSWVDKGNPVYGATSLLLFRRKVRSFDSFSSGPIVVHCSAGVGRTGTFIALDILIQQAKKETQVDIYGVVYKLRQERMNLVQTSDQYVFLHEALVEHVKYGDTSYPCSGLSERLDALCASAKGRPSQLQSQFQMFREAITDREEPDKSGFLPQNVDKNRDMDVIPVDTNRPHLSTPYKQGNDYINATMVDSFKKHNWYTVTQMPLPDTVVDFWRLVYDANCHTIVMLNDIDPADSTCKPYWPRLETKTAEYGPLKVELLREEKSSEHIIIRDFKIDRLPAKTATSTRRPMMSREQEVRQFQLLGWPRGQPLPTERQHLLELLDRVLGWQQQGDPADKTGEVIVQCYDGRGASGIFCGVAYTLDRMKLEQVVDPFVAARYVSFRRPEFFNALEEYKVLFDMAIASMERYS